MSAISGGIKDLFSGSVRFLNQPLVKEGVKNMAGTVTFVFGLVEIYDIYQILRGREISTESRSDSPQWMQTAHKVVVVCAKISLILSAAVSRPGIFLISSLAESVFSTSQLKKIFGPNTIFAVNPWHPRHIVSIAAVILAFPSVAQSAYIGVNWAYRKIRQHHDQPAEGKNLRNWLTDTKMRLMALFNTVTSRPFLHIGNQLVHFV